MSPSPSRPTSTASRTLRRASPSTWSSAVISPLVIAPEPGQRASPPRAALDYPVVRVPSLALPRLPGLPGRRPPGRGCARRWPSTAPTWFTWPARSCSAPAAARRPGGSGCRWSPCTRPTCPPTPAPTGSARAGEAARLAPAAPDPQCRRPHPGPVQRDGGRAARARLPAGLAVGPGRGHRALRPGQAQRASCAPSSPRAERCWPATSGGWPRRSASTCWPRWRRCLACGW